MRSNGLIFLNQYFFYFYISIENYNSFNYIFGIAAFSFILLGFTYLRIFLSIILEPKYTNINLKKENYKIDTSLINFSKNVLRNSSTGLIFIYIIYILFNLPTILKWGLKNFIKNLFY